MNPDQTSFERTHVLGALELHGLKKASSALSSGQWSGTCLIRGHFGLGRSDQRQFRAHFFLVRETFRTHFCLIRGQYPVQAGDYRNQQFEPQTMQTALLFDEDVELGYLDR